MLSAEDYSEACRRYKDKRAKCSERQRYHALSLASQGYSYRGIGRILLLAEETISQWGQRYAEQGLAGLQNQPRWGGEQGQRLLKTEQLEEWKAVLRSAAMPGTQLGSGGRGRARRQLLRERFGVSSSKRGVRKLRAPRGWSYQRGRQLYLRRKPAEQARFAPETEEAFAPYAASGTPGRAAGRGSKHGLSGRHPSPALESRWAATARGRRCAQ